jgi:hypothetical protein
MVRSTITMPLRNDSETLPAQMLATETVLKQAELIAGEITKGK